MSNRHWGRQQCLSILKPTVTCIGELWCIQKSCRHHITILHTGLKTRKSLQWASTLTFGCDGFRTGTFVMWPCQNVRLLINALLKRQNVLYFFFVCTKTLTPAFPSTGTWVTFGGQISDEVRNCVRLIIQSQVMSWCWRTLFSEQLWQFTAPIRSPHGSNLVQLHIKRCEYNTVMRTASISWYGSRLVSPCWLHRGQVVRSYCTLSQVIKRKASSCALIWPWSGGRHWIGDSLSLSDDHWD